MIHLRVLGAIDLRGEAGGPVVEVLAQPRRLALLTYLALAEGDTPRRRDSILALFWPERDQESARAALNKAVHFLRRALGSESIVTRGADEVAVDRTQLWCDVVEFRQAVALGDGAAAMSLWKGELLPGFFVDGAQPFDEWMERERAELRQQAARAARRRADELEKLGELTAASDLARQAVDIAVDDERAVRHLISLLDRVGDRAGALREYERFSSYLRAEYSAEPSEETRALAARLLVRESRPASTTISPQAEGNNGGRQAEPTTSADTAPMTAPVSTLLPRRPRRWIASLATLLLAVASVAAFGTWRRNGRVVDLDPSLIVVAPFVRAGGDAAVDPGEWAIVVRMTASLVAMNAGQFVPPSRVHALANEGAPAGASLGESIARRAGAGLLVRVIVRELVGGVELRAELLRMPTQRVVTVTEAAVAATVEAAADSLRERLAVAVAAHRDWGDDYGWGTDHRLPRSLAAYRAARLADETRVESEWPLWQDALKHDPTWPRAQIEGTRWSDSLAEVVRRQLSTYPEGDQDHARYRLSVRSRDWEDGYRAMQRRIAADSVTWAHGAALMAYWTERHEEAVRHGARRDLANYWTAPERRLSQHQQLLSMVLHSLGRFEEELALAAELRTRFPEQLFEAVTIEVQAYAGLGRVRELERVLRESQGLKPNLADGAATLSRAAVAAQELLAHGDSAGARRIAEIALPWFQQRMRQGSSTAVERDGYLDLLWPAQRWEELASVAREQVRAAPNDPWGDAARSFLAIAERKLGRLDAAERALQPLRLSAAADSSGEVHFLLARALFAMGDSLGGMDDFRASYRRGFWAAHSEHVRHRQMPRARHFAPYRALTRPR